MYAGAQISLHPMSADFVSVIMNALGALDPYRERMRIETDDISTHLSGAADELFPAMRDLFAAAAATGEHVVLSATVSRGCPGGAGEPEGPEPAFGMIEPLSANIDACLTAVSAAPVLGQTVAAQFAYYPLGENRHMDGIEACIAFLSRSGVLDRPKNFVTKLRGDAGPVFETLGRSFLCFAPAQAHVAMDVTVSANSPSAR
ncbi:YkoF family thiamine/hydroxymethylpyrimidine-binding protein [Aureimonas mangrovi]|uniref:YkoF family thiamine/hydroxymethylpyrimidine-binding protein n=1 Tax=Aureimonas mangrovi TaxID=2758041 RepID=UPI00163D94F0|nr:YkoF family thiamine/hydroxymethylpyrimidine-binding protein [Aureimonas mangrovi]